MEKGRILIVDDEESIRTSLVDLLGKNGYDALAVEDGYKALEKVKEEEWDVALVDLKMPGIDGFEVLKKIGEINPHMVVIIITAYGTVDNAVAAMKEGAADYVMKPFTADEICIRVEKVLEKRRLVNENIYLRQELSEQYTFANIIGKSKSMLEVFKLIEKAAPTDSTILIRGQSGTGKELIARAIHHNSLRKDKKFIAVDCGALPETLLESELFGHVKGSFTGAIVTKRGLLEVANGGTFFLDEVGDLSLGIQSKLLRVLQEKEFRQVGGIKNIRVDVRLIAATNQDLEKMIREGKFREDLFYRLNIVPIHLPMLKERKEDIPLLVHHFLEIHNKKRNKNIKGLSAEAMELLTDYDWPGNVRELENIIERLVIMSEGELIEVEHLPIHITGKRVCFTITAPRTNKELKELRKQIRAEAIENIEKAFLIEALKKCDWNISKAARDVGMKRQNFQALMRKYKIKP
ncbi:MAG: sigma-54-dependent Fis family transcriptional regulator [candidate division WOR-3 bacterium]|nr:MAG: sigma-54-dependent Fis family transcriptional regulator [candidate division WOR-3 bacterium]